MNIPYTLLCLVLLPYIKVGVYKWNCDKIDKQTVSESMRKSLSLTGRVADVRLIEENNHSIRFKVTLELEFVNNSEQPIILRKGEYWIGAETLGVSPDAVTTHKFIYSSSHWPSVYSSSKWVELRKQYDKPDPPPDLTHIIAPGESFSYEAETVLYFQKNAGTNKIDQTWEEIKIYSPVWLQVTVETWPVNIEPRVDPQNPQFGKKLQQRWKQFGELYLERLSSEPIQLTFPKN